MPEIVITLYFSIPLPCLPSIAYIVNAFDDKECLKASVREIWNINARRSSARGPALHLLISQPHRQNSPSRYGTANTITALKRERSATHNSDTGAIDALILLPFRNSHISSIPQFLKQRPHQHPPAASRTSPSTTSLRKSELRTQDVSGIPVHKQLPLQTGQHSIKAPDEHVLLLPA